MAAADYIPLVQTLYVSYFGRPADTFGLANFAAQLDALKAPTTLPELNVAVQTNAPLKALVNSFSGSAESAALYGTGDTVAFVSAIYTNLLNRTPDFDGLVYWVNAINSGQLTRANASLAIASATQSNTSAQGVLDAALINNKVAVATSFTTAINTGEELAAYSGATAAASARNLLANVTPTTVPAQFQATVEGALAQIVIAAAPVTVTTLGVGIDTLNGGTANDTFNALNINATTGGAATTLGAFDAVNGGAGSDTLNIYTDNANNLKQVGTVTAVETINIFNQGTTGVFGEAAGVDASKFVGATAVWQSGLANKVVGLGNTTTAGFTGIDLDSGAAEVVAASTTASIALDKVIGDEADDNAVNLEVSGDALSSVNVSGNIVKADANGDAAFVALEVTVGKDVTGLTLNTGLDTVLTVVANGKDVASVNAAASVGGIELIGGAALATIATGAGNDVVTIATTLNDPLKAASVSTGAGNDAITITATGTAGKGDTLAADAGAGNDKISLTVNANVAYTVTGGAGDDVVTLVSGVVKATDAINGGDGKDTIALAGLAAYVEDDYIVFNKVLKGFETVQFTTAAAGSTTAIDASKLAAYKAFSFDLGGKIDKVAADQILTTKGNLTVNASGYESTKANGAALTVIANDAATVTANGTSLNLTANAQKDDANTVVVAGDFKTATITLNSAVNTDKSLSHDTVTVLSSSIAATTAVTLSGNGIANVTNVAASKLVSIDASALNTADKDGAAVAGLTFSSVATAAETIKLGNSIDNVTIGSSLYGAMDTVTGLKLILNSDNNALTAASDNISLAAGAVFNKFTTTQTDFELAVKEAAASTNNNVVFQQGGDTYIFVDAGTAGSVDAADTIVKLTGTINLDALIVALA